MGVIKTVAKRSISAEQFISDYNSGRRDFTNLIVDKQKFEIPSNSAVVKPIIFDKIDCSNSTFENTLFNSTIFIHSKLSGCSFEKASFVGCKILVVDAQVSNFIGTNIYNTEIYGFNVKYSRLFGLDIELSTIYPNTGFILGKNDITSVNLFAENCNNIGLENICIVDVVKATESQFLELKRKKVNTDYVEVVASNELAALRRTELKSQVH